MKRKISIIGAGLSGCEAALQLAARGYQVKLYEMRPLKQTEAHQSGLLAELVCSNSLKSTRLDTASGLLKAELHILGCMLLPIAHDCSVPAGHALAVDRSLFASRITQEIEANPQIQLFRQEITKLPEGKVIVATGPLSSSGLMHHLVSLLGEDQLFFFDAIAPIIDADSIDLDKVYAKARYDKGEPDYLNCAFEKDEYYRFVDALLEGEIHEAHEFEDAFFSGESFNFYENCIPIEELARRGKDTLRHGVMRPMGLEVPSTGQKAYAVLQLRAENKDRTAYNLVGCQTMLRYPEQKRIFKLIPGLADADFLRYGSIHRNTYLNSPLILSENLSLKARADVFVAGQLSGVEGYVECIATGLLVAGIIAGEIDSLPEETILGQLWRRLLVLQPKQSFSPVNANFGILPVLENAPRDKRLKRQMLCARSIQVLSSAFSKALAAEPIVRESD
ncbi:MAG: methylenetetrahydrofolate--tRNA-(uracil(54)-C(5))-methyltransferase (FADH(2)-oxidizing) TrmFO [Candidatus Cloacimonetes bacterium]|nr:methylenetetrahydrofolate--tRNA-(uracil(54)-C(5))-methyltransferase (FADH(2)-oxidizing) TrmFO [Candidatus Cloacimonadota bacterium]MCB5287363.1 methylenetetrahydrofolate--tRNA-(uracil(54)-C(5))-methyltransferase (FADH(2)-oxidizing) TrmFO [Candidatus Cloacimonadota bacterium]MCK9184334.1 methylenetetrahydrofolate--tRNA-(uracil(54)-C(5))-methyltransferase (FADH(2)-oxidizing) TrmFO [Candidatus Cloacimonadota bacterium]MCK9583813.1 methylenetetrahydrofolate--tRNA-(uracil(54)-C(5))-methyltransfera